MSAAVRRFKIALLAGITLVAPAGAAHSQQLLIVSAQHDAATNQLIIRGGPFAAGARVFLAQGELPVVSVTSNEIRTSLASPQPGSHLLLLFQPPTALAWFIVSITTASPSPAAPLSVYDSLGQRVGQYSVIVDEYALWVQNGELIASRLSREGFVEHGITLVFWYATPDCSGTRYMDMFRGGNPLRTEGRKRGGAAAYEIGPTEQVIVASNEQFPLGSDLLTGAGGTCNTGPQPTQPLPLRRAEIVDISRLVPPFTVR